MEKQVYEFIAVQNGEKILEWKKCPSCDQEFAITDKDLEFYAKISPVFNGKKYTIPVPTLCPDCRQQTRLTRRNERKLYKRKCDLTGRSVISIYSPDLGYKVYDVNEWFGDKWDAVDYGKDFDFNRTFMEQFDELLKSVPHMNIMVMNNENSDYVNMSANVKDCYLIFGSSQNTNCLYDRWTMNSDRVVDCNNVSQSQNCYECIDINNCQNSTYCIECYDCVECNGCYNLIGCNNCIGCYNLRNKTYCIDNKQYTKQEYELLKENYKNYEKILDSINLNSIHKYAKLLSSENCFGDYISQSKNVECGFDIEKSEDLKYVTNTLELKDSYDLDFQAFNTSRVFDSLGVENAYNIYFSFGAIVNNNVYYSYLSLNSSNLFGCACIRDKHYCILNKQYTKEEYEELVPKIIEHMQKTGERGQYLKSSISPFGYNETIANEYFPLTRDEAISKGFKRQEKEYPINVPEGIELIKGQDLSDNIKDIDDDILKKAVVCEVSGKPFRIVKLELDFYRKHNLPLPRKHPDIRHLERLNKRAPRTLYLKTCDNCGKQVISVYPQNSEFKVYCEDCYVKETY